MPFPYKTPQEAVAEDVFKDMTDHAEYLQSIAKGDIFEIGVRQGFSTGCFLIGLEKNGGHLFSLDIESVPGQLFPGHPQWTFIQGDSINVVSVKEKIPAALDILMIDGDHSYEGVKADLENYAPLVRVGGKIIMHDVVSAYDPGVRVAADEFAAAHNYQFEIFKSWVGLGCIHV